MTSFISIFRFRSDDDKIYYGEAGEADYHSLESLVGRKVPTFEGQNPWDRDFKLTSQEQAVSEVS